MAWPPRRVIVIVCSIVGARPMTSKATSAPRWPVSSITWATASPSLAFTVSVAPNFLAISSLSVDHVDGDDPLGAGVLGALDHVEADAAAADDGDGVALADVAVFTAAPKPVSTPQPMSAADVIGIVVGDLHGADRGDDRLLGERARRRHLRRAAGRRGRSGT